MENKDLLIIDHKEFELTVDKVEELKKPFIPMADKFLGFIPKIEDVLKDKNYTPELSMKAKALKLEIARVRTMTGKLKDSEKKGVLQVGNAIQKCHNVIVNVIKEKEEELDKVVKHFENLEAERIKELRLQRIELLIPYEVENVEEIALGTMEDSVFDNFLAGCKKSFEDKKAEEEKLEAERIVREKAEAEQREKDRIENEKLKKEAAEREVELEKEREANRLEQERKDKELEKERLENKRIQDQKDEEARLAREKADKLEQEKQAEISRKENEKKAREQAEKQAEYVKFLKDNGVNEETKENFKIEHKTDGSIILYKKIAELIK